MIIEGDMIIGMKIKNDMVRIKYLIMVALWVALVGQSCVHGDLDDCPPMVEYAVAFKYTEHLGTRDRFYDDVKKISLYVFDENNYFNTFVYEVAPGGRFEPDFKFSLNELPMGKYTMVAWGNVLDSEPFKIPTTFSKGVTKLEAARLELEKTADSLSTTQLEKLFFGRREIEVPLYVNRTDTIPLVNDTKNIRIVIHWDHANLQPDDLLQYDSVIVQLKGTNAQYNFKNDSTLRAEAKSQVTYDPHKKYLPQTKADSALKEGKVFVDNLPALPIYDEKSYEEQVVKKSTKQLRKTVYDFTVLRLYENVPLELTIQIADALNRSTLRDLIKRHDIISGTDGCQWQFRGRDFAIDWRTTFDRNDYYQIDVYIYQDRPAGTFVTGQMKILNWWLINYADGGGRN